MTEKDSQKNKRTWKREAAEWLIMLSIGLFIYAMGWHTELLGRLQQAVLWTGIIQPETELAESDRQMVSYDMPLISLDGEHTDFSRFKGDVVFLNFWATWCPPCIAEMPNIQALYEQYQENDAIKFVMVSLDEDPEKARQFLKDKGFTFDAYRLGGHLPDIFQSSVVPTTYVITKNGQLATKKQGMANYNTAAFKNFLNTLLDE